MTPPDTPLGTDGPLEGESPLGPRRLDVSADLRIDIDGAPDAVRVTGDGSRLVVSVADAATAARIARDGRRLGGARETLAALTGGLSELGLDVDIDVGGRRVATVGPQARSGPIARAVGLDGVQVEPPSRRVQVALGALAVGLVAGLVLLVRRR